MSKVKIVLVDDSIHLKPYNQRHLAYTVVFRYLVSLNLNKACSLFLKEKQSIVLFAALILKFQDNFIHLRDHNKRFDFFQLALIQHPAFVAIFFNLINVDVFFQKIIRRYAGFKGSKFKPPAFTLSIKKKKNYTDDLTILFSRKRQREREREIYRCHFTAQSSRLDQSCKIYFSQFFFCFLFLIVAHSILGDPGDVSRVGRKGAIMVFKHGLKITKNPQNIVPTNRRAASPEFFQCANTNGYCLAILLPFVHQRVKCRQSRNGQLDINPVYFKILSTQKLNMETYVRASVLKTLSFQKYKLELTTRIPSLH